MLTRDQILRVADTIRKSEYQGETNVVDIRMNGLIISVTYTEDVTQTERGSYEYPPEYRFCLRVDDLKIFRGDDELEISPDDRKKLIKELSDELVDEYYFYPLPISEEDWADMNED